MTTLSAAAKKHPTPAKGAWQTAIGQLDPRNTVALSNATARCDVTNGTLIGYR